MEYVTAAIILHETGEEINETNLTAVLESAGVDVSSSRVKALVAALEGVDLAEVKSEAHSRAEIGEPGTDETGRDPEGELTAGAETGSGDEAATGDPEPDPESDGSPGSGGETVPTEGEGS